MRLKTVDNHMGTPCIVCAARASGLTLHEIAEAVGWSQTKVRTHTASVETPRHRATSLALTLLAAGVDYRSITARTGIFPSRLAILNRRYLLPERKTGRRRVESALTAVDIC